MADAHPNKTELFDLKHDRGGLIDVEFIVQYLVLGYAHQHASLTGNLGNIALLGMAGELGLIPADQAAAVADSYREYRRLQHGLRLNNQASRVPREQVAEMAQGCEAVERGLRGHPPRLAPRRPRAAAHRRVWNGCHTKRPTQSKKSTQAAPNPYNPGTVRPPISAPAFLSYVSPDLPDREISLRPPRLVPLPVSGQAVAGAQDPMTQAESAAQAAVAISFADLALCEPIQRAIAETGYTVPTPIQAQAIPQVLAGGDLMAAAQTGTGKTAGFTLPILHILAEEHAHNIKPGRPRCLILTPTRELAAQVEESVQTYGKHLPLTSMVMFGGVAINPQITRLKKIDILVATPGRLLDHCTQKTIDLSGVEILVLDEADRMLDMGFIRDIKKILALLPKKRQNLLFSATFSDEIKALADGLLHQPGFVEVARRNTASELVTQSVHLCPQKVKRELLAFLIKKHQWFQVLVFTRTKHGANKLAEYLGKHDIPSAAIHGNKSQSARTRALADFKDAKLQVLVATDIAARGLDIDQLPQVVNFELPNVPKTTCTASAAPAAPAPAAPPCRWSTATSCRC
jgi:ATP-dependent RNA helicase RhlE